LFLEPGLVVYKIYNGYWCFGWLTVAELRQDLRAVLKEIKERFFPTAKTYATHWPNSTKSINRNLSRCGINICARHARSQRPGGTFCLSCEIVWNK
jgi:hypothetical protein